MIVAIGTLFIGISTALAQEQKRRLMDRLLKPNASLANPAQNKKFSNKQMAPLDKPAHTKIFYPLLKPVAETIAVSDLSLPADLSTCRRGRAGGSSSDSASCGRRGR